MSDAATRNELNRLVEDILADGVESYLTWYGGHHKWTLSTERLRDDYALTHSEAKRLKDRLVEMPALDLQKVGNERKGRPI